MNEDVKAKIVVVGGFALLMLLIITNIFQDKLRKQLNIWLFYKVFITWKVILDYFSMRVRAMVINCDSINKDTRS